MLDAVVDRALTRTEGPSLSVAVANAGSPVVAYAAGFDRREEGRAASPHTVYNIASLTKQFTAACVLLLAGEGALRLDDPLARYLPGITNGERITLRQLLTHTSGYIDYYPLGFADEDKLHDSSPEEIVARYTAKPLQFEPGTAWSYSNTGYHVLGMVVEAVTRRPFGAVLAERLLRPAGMDESFFNEPQSVTQAHALGYTRFALGPLRPTKPECAGWLYSSGGIASTAPDLARWCVALLGGRVLDANAFAEMTTPQPLADGTLGPAMGWFVERHGSRKILQHAGGLAGFSTQIILSPHDGCAVVVLANGDHVQTGLIARALFAEVTHSEAPPPVVTAASAAQIRELVRWTERFASGAVDDASLMPSLRAHLTDERRADARAGLSALGALRDTESSATGERGGMSWLKVRARFERGDADVLTRTTETGKLAEFSAVPVP